MGARPLRRAIQRYIEDPLADYVLRQELPAGSTVLVDKTPEDERTAEDDSDMVKLTFVKPEPAPQPVGVGAEGGPGEGSGDDDPTLEAPDAPPTGDG